MISENSIYNKNILVTGGTGFVGSHLVERLVNRGANVVATFISTNPYSYFFTSGLNKKVRMAHVDVCDFESIFDLITKFDINFIFHLAAQPLVEVAYHNPRKTHESNILGTVNMLESAKLYSRIKGVIVASSDKAYGKLSKSSEVAFPKPHPRGETKELTKHHLGGVATSEVKYKESDPLQGDHPYEVSKSAADLIAYSYFKTYDLPIVVTRFGNIYGEGDLNFSRIIPGTMKALVKGERLEVRSNGKYVRDYLYVKDVVEGYLLLANNIEKVKGEAFNFGSDDTLSVLEIIKQIEKILKKEIRYKILNIAKNEIPYQSLDYSKIGKKLGWKPKYNLVKCLKSIYKWYRQIL